MTSALIPVRSPAPLAGHEAVSDPPLDIIGEAPAGALEITDDLALGLTLARLEYRVEQAAQQAGARRERDAAGVAWRAVAGDEFAGTCGVSHGRSPSRGCG